MAKISSKIKDRNILTVGDTEGFLKNGGMIRFFNKKDKIKLQVNLEAVKAKGLLVSSKLLRLVEIYEPQKNN